MEWKKNGTITLPTERIKISDNKVVIDTPEEGDLGNYTCITFKQDTKTGEKTITVIGKSTI